MYNYQECPQLATHPLRMNTASFNDFLVEACFPSLLRSFLLLCVFGITASLLLIVLLPFLLLVCEEKKVDENEETLSATNWYHVHVSSNDVNPA